ncbi:V-type proton ATPase subunit D 1-like [Agrilus planipennis]|uniref:V-type proton ATPase subunit D 1-like n=1 Tax=Agrilus planipennis TaxID=224129 RepID=A0A1W4WMP3_AGRPL|nr:V-type proton ATPase subunit D 1-like [Agrilus planipennis]
MALDIRGTATKGNRECFNVLTIKLKFAQKGYKLLKRKTDALNLKLRVICREMLLAKFAVEEIMKDAFMSLAEVKFAAGNIANYTLQNVAHAHIKVKSKTDYMASVQYETFEMFESGSDTYELTGLARGGQHLAKLKKIYQRAIEFVVQLASLQSCFTFLQTAVKTNETRVKALEFVLIPKIKRALHYIGHMLEEMDREEFHRLKMVKNKKKELMGSHAIDVSEPEYEFITIFNDENDDWLLYR